MVAPRYRCVACGNLTRFDVTVNRCSRAYYHYTVGGALTIESEDVVAEVVDEVTCRWCGSSSAVQRFGDDQGNATAGDR